jgi:tetratricopeptide (TPR) repeat protein
MGAARQAPGAYLSAETPAELEVGEQQLERGRSTLDEAVLLAARKTFEQCLRQNPKGSRCAYGLAHVDSYLVQMEEWRKDRKAAEHWLDAAIEDAKHTVEIDDKSSDAHALLADLYGRKIGFGGMFAGVRYGPKANAETQRAFELEPNNPRAYAVVGRKYLFAPKMFGGDLGKAIESFRKATTIDPRYDEAFVWLAVAYRKSGNGQQSQIALSQALRLNGQSVFAKRVESGVEVQ